MTEIFRNLALACLLLVFSYIFAKSVVEGLMTGKVYLKTVGFDRETQPKMFAFAMGFNSLVAANCLLSAAYFILGGTI